MLTSSLLVSDFHMSGNLVLRLQNYKHVLNIVIILALFFFFFTFGVRCRIVSLLLTLLQSVSSESGDDLVHLFNLKTTLATSKLSRTLCGNFKHSKNHMFLYFALFSALYM